MGKNNSQSQIVMEYLKVGPVKLRYDLVSRKEEEEAVPFQKEQTSKESPTYIDQNTADDKANRMLEKFDNEHFNRVSNVQRMRFHLLRWVIRNKIIGSLERLFDLILVIPLLVVASPLIFLTAIAIKLDSPGPVFFKQVRVGKWGGRFDLFKFRSMVIDAEAQMAALLAQNDADEVIFKMKVDPRVTRVGRFIRKFSLDELPQLFNVLKGDMRLVGPRPPVPYEVEQYQYDYLRRLDVVPGITGLQQVSGRSDLPFKQWVELDLQYIEEKSLLKDIEILLRTIPAVIRGRGAY
jgi:lipopolysaccharide/colanic/teichoic acid biosynthesis glycosyltransferase